MRICLVSSTVFAIPPRGYSGLEQIVWESAKGLAAKGHKVAVVAPQGSSCPGCEIVAAGPPGGWDEARAYQSYWKRLLDFDAVIDHSWMKFSYILKEEGALKAPVLGVMHAPVDTMYRELPPVERPCVVCISEDQAAHFRALFSGRDARVCRNGVDPEFYRPLGVPRSGRFLFLARFSRIKGALLAIEACKKAGAGLDLVGDTTITNEPDYLKRCLALADGKQIRFVGGASRSECVWWFSQAHALLHPVKEFREPFGLAPVEAMLCGCPVIAWDNGACRETIGKQIGTLVRSEDELTKAVQNAVPHELDGFGPKFRQEVREHALQFGVQAMTDRYEELCREAIETGGW